MVGSTAKAVARSTEAIAPSVMERKAIKKIGNKAINRIRLKLAECRRRKKRNKSQIMNLQRNKKRQTRLINYYTNLSQSTVLRTLYLAMKNHPLKKELADNILIITIQSKTRKERVGQTTNHRENNH